MQRGGLLALAGLALVAPCVVASCSDSPSHHQAERRTTTTTTAPPTTTTTNVTTTTMAGPAVPSVIGLKIDAARYILHAVGFNTVPLNTACNKGSLASQSVVAALSIPGHAPFYAVGATPLLPGTIRPKGSTVAITWSDCYPNGTSVPAVVGLKFFQATHDLHVVGLTWACFSVDSDTATTATTASTTTTTALPPSTSSSTATTHPPTTTTTHPPTTTTTKPSNVILTQSPTAGATVKASTSVTLTMHTCPQ